MHNKLKMAGKSFCKSKHFAININKCFDYATYPTTMCTNNIFNINYAADEKKEKIISV